MNALSLHTALAIGLSAFGIAALCGVILAGLIIVGGRALSAIMEHRSRPPGAGLDELWDD